MSSQIYSQRKKQDKFMTEEQFEEIINVILEGKYSWACVLILRSAGYNPLHYIPYRTYNRIMKDNCPNKRQRHQPEKVDKCRELSTAKMSDTRPQNHTSKIGDLAYLENINKHELRTYGGWRIQQYSLCEF